jgi:hypothetical protein
MAAAAERGEVGARGAAGAGGMMPAGSGRRRDADAEHKRPSFLVEADADELFGTDQRTAPPVIGG